MSAVPQSTIGYERRFNWAFAVEQEDEFVRQVLEGQPEPPRYFGIMKRINREGPPVLGVVALPERMAEHRIEAVLAAGSVVVDLRAAADFAAGHIPGTLNLPFNNSFATWAGSLLPYDRDLYLLLDQSARLERVIQQLLLIGIDRIRGWFSTEAIELWSQSKPLEQIEQLGVGDLARKRNGLVILDVRGRSEWELARLPGATLIPLAELPDRLDEVPADQPVAVHCQGGGRSAIAASLLLSRGRRAVANVAGGLGAWLQAGLPVERSKP